MSNGSVYLVEVVAAVMHVHKAALFKLVSYLTNLGLINRSSQSVCCHVIVKSSLVHVIVWSSLVHVEQLGPCDCLEQLGPLDCLQQLGSCFVWSSLVHVAA